MCDLFLFPILYTLACNGTRGLFVFLFLFLFFYCKLYMIDSHFKELANVGHIVVSLNLLWVIKTSVCIALYFSSYRFGAHEFQRRGPVGMLMGNSGSSWNDMWWSEKQRGKCSLVWFHMFGNGRRQQHLWLLTFVFCVFVLEADNHSLTFLHVMHSACCFLLWHGSKD